MAAMTTRIRIGIDTGGTFTDVVALDESTGDAGHHQDPVDAGRTRPTASWRGSARCSALLGGEPRRRLGQPRHHGGHQPAARGQGRRPGLHHHRGLRVPARDRPAVACPTATATRYFWVKPPRIVPADRVRTVGGRLDSPGARGAAVRRGRRRRRGPVVPRRGHRHHRRLLPALLRRPRARAGHARGAAARAPGRRRLDLQRGAARVPGVRARRDHPRRRRGEAADGVLRREHRRRGCATWPSPATSGCRST